MRGKQVSEDTREKTNGRGAQSAASAATCLRLLTSHIRRPLDRRSASKASVRASFHRGDLRAVVPADSTMSRQEQLRCCGRGSQCGGSLRSARVWFSIWPRAANSALYLCFERGQKVLAPHAAAARLYVGDCRSWAVPSARYQPLPPMALPLLGGGGELVGSGKFGTSCARMHLARSSSCSLLLSDAFSPPGACASLAQARWADLNAGASVLMSLGMINPPVGLGSGNLGTPCARMHCASRSRGPPVACAASELPDDPHAPITAQQITPANAPPERRAFARRPVLKVFKFAEPLTFEAQAIHSCGFVQPGA